MTFNRHQHHIVFISRRRKGMTLMEMLLVMMLIVMIAALSWPLMQGFLHKSGLRSGADQFRTAIAEARVKAMSSGLTVLLEYEVNTGNYRIAPWNSGTDDIETSSTFPLAEEKKTLPEGLIFVSGQKVENRNTGNAPPPDDGSGSTGQTNSQTTLLFYPDGSTSSAEIQLSNEKRSRLVVSLRGITGVTLVTEQTANTDDPLSDQFVPRNSNQGGL